MGEQVQGVLGIELLGQGRCEKTRLGSGLGFWSRLTSFVPVSYGNLVNHTMFLMVFMNIICYISVVYIIVKGGLSISEALLLLFKILPRSSSSSKPI